MRRMAWGCLLALALAGGPARAETDAFKKDVDECFKVASLPPDQVIAACSRLLADPEVNYGMRRDLVASLYFNRAFGYYKQKNYERANLNLKFALGLNPRHHDSYLLRGKIKADTGQDRAAILDYNQCLQLKPRSEVCYFNRAMSYSRLKNYAQAIRDFTIVIQIEPKAANAYAGRGAARDWLRQRQGAIADYRMAISLGSTDASVRNRLAALQAGAVTPQAPQRAEPAPGTPVNFTWRFRNNTGGAVHVKLYARERRNWWPTASTNWRMDGVGPYSFTISCLHSEKVCYGAWQSGNTDRYWGVGFQDQHGCQTCCYACRPGQTTLYSLNP